MFPSRLAGHGRFTDSRLNCAAGVSVPSWKRAFMCVPAQPPDTSMLLLLKRHLCSRGSGLGVRVALGAGLRPELLYLQSSVWT